jgi:integrase/recombinase XerD
MDLDVKNKNSRKTYIYELEKAFKNQEFSDLEQFDYQKLRDYVKTIKNKKSASNLKTALDKFSNVFSDFKYKENEKFLSEQVSNKSKRRLTKREKMNMSKTFKNINFMQNDKERLAFRTILDTGLRIDELSNLKKKDVKIEDGKLYVNVEKGKHNKKRVVEALGDEYLKKSLIEYIKKLNDEDKLFYSKGHLQNIATKKNFESHDLRRAFAKVLYKKVLSEKGRNEAIKEVQKRLGHELYTTTYKKYLSRNIDFSKTKWE